MAFEMGHFCVTQGDDLRVIRGVRLSVNRSNLCLEFRIPIADLLASGIPLNGFLGGV